MSNPKNHPLVSVFMPTFNQDHLVVEAIESVLAQDHENWELIIGDDCSTDNTYSIIKNLPTKISNEDKAIPKCEKSWHN